MAVTGILSMLVIGTIVGFLGRLVVPGRHLPMWATILVGVLAAFAGTIFAGWLGVSDTAGFDWLELLLQVLFAAIGVVALESLYGRRKIKDGLPTNRPAVNQPVPPSPQPQSRLRPSSRPPQLADETANILRYRPIQPPSAPPPVYREYDELLSSPIPSRIFISYRRTDSRHAARGIADRLRNQFGPTEVFMDVDSLDPGVDFLAAVLHAIRASAIVLVLIGDRWLTAEDGQGRRRLYDPTDNVRMEIEHALGLKKPLLPVLLDGANMPHSDDLPGSLAPLPRLNGIRLNHESWDVDIAALIQALTRLRP